MYETAKMVSKFLQSRPYQATSKMMFCYYYRFFTLKIGNLNQQSSQKVTNKTVSPSIQIEG